MEGGELDFVDAFGLVAAGDLTLYGSDSATPGTSNVNWSSAGQTIANSAVVKPGPDGKIKIRNASAGTVDVTVFGNGWWATATGASGGTFAPLAPARIVDTRDGTGTPRAQIPAGTAVAVKVTGTGGVPGPGVAAVAVNLTVPSPAATVGAPSAYSSDETGQPPGNLAFEQNKTIAAFAFVKVGADGNIKLFNFSAAPIDDRSEAPSARRRRHSTRWWPRSTGAPSRRGQDRRRAPDRVARAHRAPRSLAHNALRLPATG